MRGKKNWDVFTISKRTYTILAIATIILLAAYFGCICWESSVNSDYIESVRQGDVLQSPGVLNFITFLESLITIIFSVFLSSVITTFIMSKREKNDIYKDAFSDMIDNVKMQVVLPEKPRTEVVAEFKKTVDAGNVPSDMVNTVIKKALLPKQKYYYQNCVVKIKCRINGAYLEKEIMKDMFVKSYEPVLDFGPGEFKFASQCGLDGVDTPLSIKNITVSCKGESAKPKYKVRTQKIKDDLAIKQGYVNENIAFFEENFQLHADEATKISTYYTTRVPLRDLTYVFRVPCSCKHLSLSCQLVEMKNYSISGSAFGFLDDAKDTLSGESKMECKLDLEDWSFYGDGACFTISKDCD